MTFKDSHWQLYAFVVRLGKIGSAARRFTTVMLARFRSIDFVLQAEIMQLYMRFDLCLRLLLCDFEDDFEFYRHSEGKAGYSDDQPNRCFLDAEDISKQI